MGAVEVMLIGFIAIMAGLAASSFLALRRARRRRVEAEAKVRSAA